MQTALQKLKTKLETQKEFYGTRFPQFISWIDELMGLEKEQIQNAFTDGQIDIFKIVKKQFSENGFKKTDLEIQKVKEYGEQNDSSLEYYNETFKND